MQTDANIAKFGIIVKCKQRRQWLTAFHPPERRNMCVFVHSGCALCVQNHTLICNAVFHSISERLFNIYVQYLPQSTLKECFTLIHGHASKCAIFEIAYSAEWHCDYGKTWIDEGKKPATEKTLAEILKGMQTIFYFTFSVWWCLMESIIAFSFGP
jgi:hypothetical protein